MKYLSLYGVALALLFLAGCSDDKKTVEQANTAPVASIVHTSSGQCAEGFKLFFGVFHNLTGTLSNGCVGDIRKLGLHIDYQMNGEQCCDLTHPDPYTGKTLDEVNTSMVKIGAIGIELFLCLLAVMFIRSTFFTIRTKHAGVVERLGKFNRIAGPGLNFKIPLIEKLVYTADLSMQLMDVEVMSKTKDDATLTISTRVQYYILPNNIMESYYELEDPEVQINALVENVLLSYVPNITLDECYLQEDQIAARAKQNLAVGMAKFGYCIENALVMKITPAENVVVAMNDINAARREQVAAVARAEAKKIMMVKLAEGQADRMALNGAGQARERAAIITGYKNSIIDFEEGVKGVKNEEVMVMIMATMYFDVLRTVGAKSNTLLLPHSPAGMTDVFAQLREAVTTGTIAADKVSDASMNWKKAGD